MVSESEAFNDIAKILAVGGLPMVVQQAVTNYVSKYVGHSNPIHRIIRILQRVDTLLWNDKADNQASLGLGIVSDFDYFVNKTAFGELQSYLLRNPARFADDVTDDEIEADIMTILNAKWQKRQAKTIPLV